MDVHQRPSHGGMFGKDLPKTPSLTPHHSQSSNDNSTGSAFLPVFLSRVLMALGMVHVTSEYCMDITLCEGPSMAPTIRSSGEIILLDKYMIRRRRRAAKDNQRCCNVEDGITRKERCRAARLRQKRHKPIDEWHRPIVNVAHYYPAMRDNNYANRSGDDDDKKLLAAPTPPRLQFTWKDAWDHVCSPLSVGDVVVTLHPQRPGTVCKRVVGLPGDEILLQQQALVPVGPYPSDRTRREGGRQIVTVPDGHVWLEGDNANNSSDSRSYGAVPLGLIQGRVVARIWPIRGDAWMVRGSRPPPTNSSGRTNNHNNGSTVLPAGYNGEHMLNIKAATRNHPEVDNSVS